MTSERPESSVDLLHSAVRDLSRGDWRSATLLVADGMNAGLEQDLLDIAFCLARIARGMQLQSVLADVEAAWEQLEATAARLRAMGPMLLGATPPPRRLPLMRLRWETTRLVQRELADLTALRLLVEELPRGRQELIHACIEHLTFIEFDPWTVRVHPRDRELTGLDRQAYARLREGNRLDICVRATRLRQFADVRSGSVNVRTWQRMGGYACVREYALRALAEEPLTRGRPDLPVRLGRQRAWHYARVWLWDAIAS